MMECASVIDALDPLDLCEIIMCVEDEFDILIEDESKMHCIYDFVRAVEGQVA